MADKHHGKLAFHGAVRYQIFFPKVVQRFVNHWQVEMGIEIALAETGKMFACADHTGGLQSGHKLPRVKNDGFGIG